jgi:hypothetical protein
LSGRDGFGAFVEVKRLFSTAPKVKKRRRMEVTGSDRTWSRYDRTCPVSGSSKAWDARVLHRRIRSVTGPERPIKSQRNYEAREVDRTRWRVRSQSIGRIRSCVGAYWKRPDASTMASSLSSVRVRSRFHARGLCVTCASGLGHWRA